MQVLILAGGLGTRLRSILPELPKPLAPIGARPFLFYLLEQLKNQGIKEVILSVGYRASQIEEVFGDGTGIGLSIQYAREENPLGTGGALKNALPFLKDKEVLVINGDTYFDIDYHTLESFHHQWKAGVTVAIKYQTEVCRYGMVSLGLQKYSQTENSDPSDQCLYKVLAFTEKAENTCTDGFVNGGVYFIERHLIDRFPQGTLSLERDIFPLEVDRGLIYGLPFGGRFIDIGIPEDYHLAMNGMQSWVKAPKYKTLFLDRDGVINEDLGYLWRKEEIQFIPSVIKLIRQANQAGWKVAVVTNQAGVARGYYREEDVRALHGWMSKKLSEWDAPVQQFFYCPHHPDGIIPSYQRACLCRKPAPGMILKAAENLSSVLEKSLMIGDKITDLIQLPYLQSSLISTFNNNCI